MQVLRQTYSDNLYSLGKTVITPGIQAMLMDAPDLAHRLLTRHSLGDWGKCGRYQDIKDFQITDEDRALGFPAELEGVTRNHDGIQNVLAVENQERIMSVYEEFGQTIYVITERDRSMTTVLLPSEY